MASSDATPLPIKNQAFRVTFPIWDADGDLVAGAAGLDSEVSKDGGTFADCSNEATQIATSSGIYYLDLSATEMNADTVAIIVKTSTVGAKTTVIVLYPVEDTDIRANMVAISGDTAAADNAEAVFDNSGYAMSASSVGTVDSVTAVADKTDYEISSGGLTDIANAVLGMDLGSVVGAAARSLMEAARRLRNRTRVNAGTLEVYEEDDTTLAWSAAVDTDANADPIIEVDPS